MTAPIQEPTTDRALQGLAYQRDQLLRRPMPGFFAGLPMAHMANPSLTLAPNAARTDTGLTNFYTTDPAIFQQDDGSIGPNTQYLDILQPGNYATFCQIRKVTNNGQFFVYLHPSNTGAMFGGAANTPNQTVTSFIDTNILLSVQTPYDISLLAFDDNNVPEAFTVKYQWTNVTGSPTLASSAVLVIVQLSPDYLFS